MSTIMQFQNQFSGGFLGKNLGGNPADGDIGIYFLILYKLFEWALF